MKESGGGMLGKANKRAVWPQRGAEVRGMFASAFLVRITVLPALWRTDDSKQEIRTFSRFVLASKPLMDGSVCAGRKSRPTWQQEDGLHVPRRVRSKSKQVKGSASRQEQMSAHYINVINSSTQLLLISEQRRTKGWQCRWLFCCIRIQTDGSLCLRRRRTRWIGVLSRFVSSLLSVSSLWQRASFDSLPAWQGGAVWWNRVLVRPARGNAEICLW